MANLPTYKYFITHKHSQAQYRSWGVQYPLQEGWRKDLIQRIHQAEEQGTTQDPKTNLESLLLLEE